MQIIKKDFETPPFIDNPYKDIYYIDFVDHIVSVYVKIVNKSLFKFFDKDRNNRYELIGSKKYVNTNGNTTYNKIEEYEKNIFEYDRQLNYFKLSNLNYLTKIVDGLDSDNIMSKATFINEITDLDLDLQKLSKIFEEKCNIGIFDRLDNTKERKIANLTGIFSGTFLRERLKYAKPKVAEIRDIIDEFILEYETDKLREKKLERVCGK